ncbi:MAG TPA: outer membrane beta-barrel protein [Candidatus Solibacter sp.]|nr:outer membrane beta-barrel protein [Candidatus Solibacter sp.]
MRQNILNITVGSLAGLLLAGPSVAQMTDKLTFNVGGGFTEPVRASGRLDPGFNITAAGGVNLTPNFGVLAEFGFNHLDLSRRALNFAGVPDGSSRIYSVTLNPIVHFNPKGRFDAYVEGGGGYYRRTVELTTPTIATVTLFDPFIGLFFPAAIPTNTVLGSFTQNKGGLNIGAGVEVRVKEDGKAKIFAESRYHYIYTSPRATQILPVTFGLRW